MPHPHERTLMRHADGEGSERARRAVARHLLGCSRCRAVLEQLAVLRASVSALPEPPNTLLEGILSRRATGDRVLLPAFPAAPARRGWRIAALVAAGAAVILAVALLPAGQVGSDQANMGEEACMSGMRSAFYTLVLGAGLACADSPTPFELPDSAYQPVTSLAADRVMAGTYVYESAMWTDGLVSSPQARESYTLSPVDRDGVPVWEERRTFEYRYVSGQYVRRQTSEAWFERATLDGLRYVGYWDDGRPWMDVEVVGDSIIQQWQGRATGRTRRSARVRGGPVAYLGWSDAQQFAVIVSLPLADGWAGQIDGVPFAVVGREEITVPAGTFQCWRLESPETRLSRTGPGRTRVVRIPVRMWVAVDQPLVVKHEYGAIPNRRETVLVSFEPAAR
jgi:hypothetical protein